MQIHLLVRNLADLLRNGEKLLGSVSVISSELKGHEYRQILIYLKKSLAAEDVAFINNL